MSDAKAAAAARRAKILARDKSRLDIAKGLKVYNTTTITIIILTILQLLGCIRG